MSLPIPEALKDLDYMQLTLHGGRGCFHIAKDGICGRADFWAGHPVFHSFVSLQEAVTKYGQACRAAALEEAAKFIENGSFLYDQSPAKLFAEQLAPKIRGLK